MAYPTRAALVAASAVDALTSLTSAQQDALRDVSISAVESYTGQSFLPSDDAVVLDGMGARELWLPRRVETLTGVAVTGTSIDLSDVAISEDGFRVYFVPASTDYAVMAMREDAYDTRSFRAGAGMVTLTGTFGWTDSPVAVDQAIRLDMEDQASADASGLAGSVGAYRRLGLSSIAQGNLTATIGNPALVSPRVRALLDPYVWLGPAGSLI